MKITFFAVSTLMAAFSGQSNAVNLTATAVEPALNWVSDRGGLDDRIIGPPLALAQSLSVN